MKIYLIVALFLGALVVAHSLEEDEKVELPEVPEQPDQSDEEISDPAEEETEDVNDPSGGTEGDTEESEDEEVNDEEEDPEKRRRPRNILSLASCRELKRRGYCRRPLFIRRLCAATCYVPPGCRDRLSRISCLRLKGFRKCNGAVGRLYCQKSCRHCGVDPCRRYAVLNQLNRRQSRPTGNAKPLCDQQGFATRWYRFTGLAGSRLPNRAPPKNRCGTHAPGYMVGSYPRRGQVVRRKVCYHWGNNSCNWSNFIRVKNCGRYFVFFLRPTPVCHLRYCGNA